ncbi:hypothetical protein C8J57DRAFT_1716161 [Mycena rebaudengoi]|nr:hypothetical protein C8J57DRAFT_1716161 [Mycena rebaudengoi]
MFGWSIFTHFYNANSPPRLSTIITTRRLLGSLGPLTMLKLAQTPVTPAHRYADWVAAAVAPLEELFINEPIDPHDVYGSLREIAEGENDSARDLAGVEKGARVLITIKSVALIPDYDERADEEGGVGQKLVDVRRELEPGGYGGAGEGGLEAAGSERYCAVCERYTAGARVPAEPPRDLRSGNLLLNGEGVLKFIDRAGQTRVAALRRLRRRPVQPGAGGSGSYDALKVDVWSVGATVWERAVLRHVAGRERARALPARIPRIFKAVLRDRGAARGVVRRPSSSARADGRTVSVHDARPSSTDAAPFIEFLVALYTRTLELRCPALINPLRCESSLNYVQIRSQNVILKTSVLQALAHEHDPSVYILWAGLLLTSARAYSEQGPILVKPTQSVYASNGLVQVVLSPGRGLRVLQRASTSATCPFISTSPTTLESTINPIPI